MKATMGELNHVAQASKNDLTPAAPQAEEEVEGKGVAARDGGSGQAVEKGERREERGELELLRARVKQLEEQVRAARSGGVSSEDMAKSPGQSQAADLGQVMNE